MVYVRPLRPLQYLFALALLFTSVTACATTGEGGTSGDSSRDRLVFSELDLSLSGKSAYDVIDELRPDWLQRRGRTSIKNPEEINVYLEGTEYGTIDALHDISAENVELAERLSSGEAQFRFGPGNTQGAIVIQLRSQ